MAVLVIAEHNHAQLKASTLNVITAALQLSNDLTVLVAGYQCGQVAEQVAKVIGVKQVLVADANVYQHQFAETLADLIVELAIDYTHILAPASSYGKNFMPRVAALLDVEQISDISAIVDSQTFKRPIYAGNAIATVQSSAATKVITVRTTCFATAKLSEKFAEIKAIAKVTTLESAVEFISFKSEVSTRPELADARIVIAGGRGLQSAENFKLLEKLVDKLGAAIGATRAAVDAGFAPNDYQVGQTGKVIAPDLYIAIGISGAIQHIAGIKDSKIIVAINNDPDAPIFKIADYGLVGDLFQLLPELEIGLSAWLETR